jgi:hypothetical protein
VAFQAAEYFGTRLFHAASTSIIIIIQRQKPPSKAFADIRSSIVDADRKTKC